MTKAARRQPGRRGPQAAKAHRRASAQPGGGKAQGELVLARGQVVARDNQFVGEKGAGRYLKRGRSILAGEN